MRVLLALLLVSIGCGDDGVHESCPGFCNFPDAPTPPYDPLEGVGSAEEIASGYMFLEGPNTSGGGLVFSDIPGNTIYSWNGTASVVRMPSGNANGLATYLGDLYAAEHGTRSVTKGGVPIVSTFEGKRLNSPNDLVFVGDTIYFTDPPYGIQDNQRELDFIGVFRFANGTLTAERRGALTERPNGIGVSPDNKTLYVDDTDDGGLYAFPILEDGSLGERSLLAMTAGGPDGLAIDAAGNIWVTSNAGIEVFSPTGTKWGTIPMPKKATNCAFEKGASAAPLYVTAQDSLYRVQTQHPGLADH